MNKIINLNSKDPYRVGSLQGIKKLRPLSQVGRLCYFDYLLPYTLQAQDVLFGYNKYVLFEYCLYVFHLYCHLESIKQYFPQMQFLAGITPPVKSLRSLQTTVQLNSGSPCKEPHRHIYKPHNNPKGILVLWS